MKFVFALSIGFQNGMSWPHCTKTHKLVRVLGNGPFPDQGPVGGAHGAGSPTQQYDFFAEQTLKISVYFMQRIKSYSIFTVRQTDRHTDTHFASLYARARFFLYGNLYLSLHYVSEAHSLTSLWRINFCQWLDLNCRPLISEATALPTESQPLPHLKKSYSFF